MLILKRRRLFSPAVHCAIVSSDAAATTAFLARTSGLSPTETAAYKAMINGMVADGVWSKLDALYIFATKDTTTANLNLISTSYGLTTSGVAQTFTADQGYTGVASGALDTGLVLTSATAYALNSAAMGVYCLNNRTSSLNAYAIGITQGSSAAELRILNSSAAEFDLNEAVFGSGATTTSQGSWFVNRSAPSGVGALSLYRNGNTGSPIGTNSGPSTSVPITNSVMILARNLNGARSATCVGDQLSAAWIGGGFSATDVANFSSRLNAYMTALGVNVY